MDFYIIGVGMGNEKLLTAEAVDIIQKCEFVVSTERISETIFNFKKDIVVCKYGELFEKAVSFSGNTAVLVSGDSGFFSAGKILKEKLLPFGNVHFVCGISCVQYFCSKICKSYDDVSFCSVHGRKSKIVGEIVYNKKVFALTGGENSVSKIIRDLVEFNLGDVDVWIGENLSYENERIVCGKVVDFLNMDFEPLSVVYFENNNFVDKNVPFFDKDFIRADVPMTKEEIRWICVNKLCIKPFEVGFDIGGGTGSVSLEMAKKAYKGIIYSFEKKEEAFSLLKKNINKTKCFNVLPVFGEAPFCFDDYPVPDFAFIGGSNGNMAEILQRLKELNPDIRVVVTAIALETISETFSIMKNLEFENFEFVNIGCSRNKAVGKYNLLNANNPIFIFSGGKFYE